MLNTILGTKTKNLEAEVIRLEQALECGEHYYGSEISRLTEEVEYLEHQLSVLTSFPIKTGDMTVYAVNLIETRLFYDTRWQIVAGTNGAITKLEIVRLDSQYRDELIKEISNCQNIGEIKALDQKRSIYND